jgi:hypothetical protein
MVKLDYVLHTSMMYYNFGSVVNFRGLGSSKPAK